MTKVESANIYLIPHTSIWNLFDATVHILIKKTRPPSDGKIDFHPHHSTAPFNLPGLKIFALERKRINLFVCKAD